MINDTQEKLDALLELSHEAEREELQKKEERKMIRDGFGEG